MNEREEKIIDAAVQLFSRYGVKRTSMNDIAGEAGIARQTLYNAFSNKDEVLRATIRLFAERSTARIQAGLEKTGELGEQLDVIFRHIAVEPFELLRASPNAEDIVEGFNASSQEEIAAAAEGNRVIIARVFGAIRSYDRKQRPDSRSIRGLCAAVGVERQIQCKRPKAPSANAGRAQSGRVEGGEQSVSEKLLCGTG